MIPGPFSICHIEFPEDSDNPILKTLRFGYDSAGAAYHALEEIAAEANVAASQCGVIRTIEREEAAGFTN